MKLAHVVAVGAWLLVVNATAQTSVSPEPPRFVLGEHYREVRGSPDSSSQQAQQTIDVLEVFWYGCPHCADLEPHVERWRESIAPDVAFERVPITWSAAARLHAQAFYTAATLGVLERIHSEMFDEILANNNPLDSEQSLSEWFSGHGIDAARFAEAFHSAAVASQVERAERIMREFRIQSVPSVVVAGKYLSNVPRAGGDDALFQLVDELVAAERYGH